MKVPENFNAGATVKTKSNPLEEAISNNFSRNPENVSSNSVTQENAVKAEPVQASVQTKREVKEKFLVSMSKGERSLFKAFCATNNVSMNHFVMCAMDYFKEDLENGKVTISPHSYKRVKEN